MLLHHLFKSLFLFLKAHKRGKEISYFLCQCRKKIQFFYLNKAKGILCLILGKCFSMYLFRIAYFSCICQIFKKILINLGKICGKTIQIFFPFLTFYSCKYILLFIKLQNCGIVERFFKSKYQVSYEFFIWFLVTYEICIKQI